MSSLFFYEPFYDFDRFFDEAFNSRFGGGQSQRRITDSNSNTDVSTRGLKPRMDLHEDKEKNLVTASFELPGVKKEDVNIDVHHGRLTVGAETKFDEQRDEHGYAVRERRYGKFSRTLQLPPDVKDSDIKAGMENGILTVTFPKSGPESAAKKITIS